MDGGGECGRKPRHKHRGGCTVNICLALHSFPKLSYFMSFTSHLLFLLIFLTISVWLWCCILCIFRTHITFFSSVLWGFINENKNNLMFMSLILLFFVWASCLSNISLFYSCSTHIFFPKTTKTNSKRYFFWPKYWNSFVPHSFFRGFTLAVMSSLCRLSVPPGLEESKKG